MRNTFLCTAFVIAASAVASAQVVHVQSHDNATDIWGPYFNARKKVTFTGYIKGIIKGRPATRADMQYSILVKSSATGETAEVEVGPEWFIKDQQAKLHVGDRVHVTGTKLTVDHHSLIVASQILLRDQGGPVLALRRPNGRAYWMPAVVAEQPSDTVATLPPPEITIPFDTTPGSIYPRGPIQINDGVTVDNGVWYGNQNTVTQINPFVRLVSGPYPIFIWPF